MITNIFLASRNAYTAERSEIRQMAYTPQAILDLFEAFKMEVSKTLIFLKVTQATSSILSNHNDRLIPIGNVAASGGRNVMQGLSCNTGIVNKHGSSCCCIIFKPSLWLSILYSREGKLLQEDSMI